MNTEIRRIVTFKSAAFNTTETKDYFINPGCYGDDVAKWLIGELRNRGVTTADAPGQEDFGWYLRFEIAGIAYDFVLGYRPCYKSDEGIWIGWLERKRGFVGSLFGGRTRGINPAAAEALHDIFSSSPEIRDARWHFQKDFDAGYEERAASSPF